MTRLGFANARHLITRTGFGAEWETVQRLKLMTLDQAVDYLLSRRDTSLPNVPRFSQWRKMNMMRQNRKRMKSVMRISKTEGIQLQEWWLRHMLKTQSPFLERMTLFWHNQFPSSIKKTKQASMLVNQNRLLRKHAFGNYGLMLREMAKDPAMLLYLDGYKNVKGKTNENFARELLELFTIGRGQYNERDIKEAARAFTGWGINDQTGKFVFDRRKHDDGTKQFLRYRGNFNGDDIITILLKHPRTAERVAEKFWSEFISISRPDQRTIKQWAHVLRSSNYNIATLLKTVLKSKPFWDARNRGGLIKSPIELAVGTLRSLPYNLPRNNLAHNLNIMGQGVFQHPSVKGWSGGQEWVSTQSLLRRASLLNNLTRGNLNSRRRRSGVALRLPNASRNELRDWLLPVAPIKSLTKLPGKQRYVRELVLDPAYQVT